MVIRFTTWRKNIQRAREVLGTIEAVGISWFTSSGRKPLVRLVLTDGRDDRQMVVLMDPEEADDLASSIKRAVAQHKSESTRPAPAPGDAFLLIHRGRTGKLHSESGPFLRRTTMDFETDSFTIDYARRHHGLSRAQVANLTKHGRCELKDGGDLQLEVM